MSSSAVKPAEKKKNRPTIGYIAQHAYDGIGLCLLRGVYDAARDLDLNLITMVGGSTMTNREVNKAEITAIRLMSAKSVDGLISWAPSFLYYMDVNELESFHRSFLPLPLINIAMPMPGIPSIVIDNLHGIRETVGHLIETHQIRRIAFVHGNLEHFYHNERFRGYRETLQEFNIPYDENLVVAGSNFSFQEGSRALSVLLDERGLKPGVDFNAIATTSDLYAAAIVENLARRGFKVPQQVAVVGFNNREESYIVSPPLTTIDTNFYHHGYQAVVELLKLLNGKPVPEQILIPTQLVLRQSCGCFEEPVTRAVVRRAKTVKAISLDDFIAANKRKITAGLKAQLKGAAKKMKPGWADKLVMDFQLQLGDKDSIAFLRRLENYLSVYKWAANEIIIWQNIISELRKQLIPCLKDITTFQRAENIWHQSRILIYKSLEYAPIVNPLPNSPDTNSLAQVGGLFNSTLNIRELLSVIRKELPKLAIPACYIAVFEDPAHPMQSKSRLLLAFNEQRQITVDPGREIYPSGQLLPESLLSKTERFCLLIESCYYKDQELGFVVFEMGPLDGALYEVLRNSFSSALYGVLLTQERIKVEKDRELLLQALEAKNRELEERNIEVHKVNEQLQSAIGDATRANQAKSTFLANMSHEMRTPLNCVLGFAEVAMGVNRPEDLKYYLGLMVEESGKLLELINQLLDISKIEAGKLRLNSEPFHFQRLMGSISSGFAVTAQNKGLEFLIELHDGIPEYLDGDSLRLRQILVNLIGNAIKFTNKGSVRVLVDPKRETDHEITLLFQIQDTGIGIPAGRQRDIFENFVQAEASTTRKYGGTGLGTAISKQLVQLMNGQIGLFSEEGRGSNFWFTVILKKVHGQISEAQEAISADVPEIDEALSILLVEDYPTNQKVVAAHLANTPCRLTIVNNGREGVEAFKKSGFDLILMDIHMPEMDGYEATRLIRREPSGQSVPIIAMVADAFETSINSCFQAGINDVIVKPYRKNTLLVKIKQWRHSQKGGPLPMITDEQMNLAAAPGAKPMDWNRILADFGGDASLLESVTNEYIQNVHRQIEVIKSALQRKDAEVIWRESHSIKGGAYNLGADDLAAKALQLEKAGRTGHLNDALRLIGELTAELLRLEQYIKKSRIKEAP